MYNICMYVYACIHDYAAYIQQIFFKSQFFHCCLYDNIMNNT